MEFGERGEVMIAGMVCLLRCFGVAVCFSGLDKGRQGEIGRPISAGVRQSKVTDDIGDLP